jgi:hypothetical protein
LKGLTNAAEGAVLPGSDSGVERSVSRDHYDRGLGIHFQELFQSAQTTDTGHGNVEQYNVVGATAIRLEPFLSGLSEIHAITLVRKQGLQNFPHYFFIVNDEY